VQHVDGTLMTLFFFLGEGKAYAFPACQHCIGFNSFHFSLTNLSYCAHYGVQAA